MHWILVGIVIIFCLWFTMFIIIYLDNKNIVKSEYDNRMKIWRKRLGIK